MEKQKDKMNTQTQSKWRPDSVDLKAFCTLADGEQVTSWVKKTRTWIEKNAGKIALAPEMAECLRSVLIAVADEKALQASRGESVSVHLGMLESRTIALLARLDA